jgi:CubicO group peptidase (beta-lactamase class C family)
VTLRHLLNHTSGLNHGSGDGAMAASPDYTAFAAAQPLVDEPGKVFSYNNEAAQLLSRIAEKLAGKPLDQFLDERLFRPLGITEWRWRRDPAGNVLSYKGVAITSRDLAKIGRLMLDLGRYEGVPHVPAAWVQQSCVAQTDTTDRMGFLWWLRPGPAPLRLASEALQPLGSDGARLTTRLAPLAGKRFETAEAFWLDAGALLAPTERAALLRARATLLRPEPAPVFACVAEGWQGQRLFIVPSAKAIVVRQRVPLALTNEENQRFGFFELDELVARLFR